MEKVVVLINDTTYAYNLRGALLKELVQNKYEVVVVGELLKHIEKLEQIGCRLMNVKTNRQHVSLLSDYILFNQYLHILKDEKPNVVLTYNIKPNVYGGYACRRLGIPYIANITGLGKPLGNTGVLQRIACFLYQQGLAEASCVFFQNESNRQFFIDHKILKSQETQLLPGSGVDLEHYHFSPYPTGKAIHFLFAARIMKEKGIDLFLEAAKEFADEKTIFDVCGFCEDKKYLQQLRTAAYIQYHGEQDDLRPFYQMSSCFLFPSYYPEGMSNVLLEAAASGRPAITTDNPGCKEAVEDGISGFIVPTNNSKAVLNAVKNFLSLTVEERQDMGQTARKIAADRFDRKKVVKAYLEIINHTCSAGIKNR